jgi:diguanylate cyclase (GGDEF)-like protein
MAASDTHQSPEPQAAEERPCLAAAELQDRMDEEINRIQRQGGALCCLLVTIGNLDDLAREHGEELSERALAFISAVLRRQLRDYDRIGRPSERELLLLLPGADGERGEMVARRALERLRTIKIEAGGRRHPLRISVGLAAWHGDLTAGELLAQTRAAARRGSSGEAAAGVITSSPPALGRP